MGDLAIKELKNSKVLIEIGIFVENVWAYIVNRNREPRGKFYNGYGGCASSVLICGQKLIVEAYQLYGNAEGQAHVRHNDELRSELYVGIPTNGALVLEYETGFWRFKQDAHLLINWQKSLDNGYKLAVSHKPSVLQTTQVEPILFRVA